MFKIRVNIIILPFLPSLRHGLRPSRC